MVCAVAGKKVKVARAHSGGSNSCDSDDDFVAPPLPFVARVQEVPISKSPAGDLTIDEDLAFPRVSTRSPAGVLVNSLKDLSCQQKDDIREMGFASLLDFNVSECPPRLRRGYSIWVEVGHWHWMVKRDRLVISNLLKHWRGKFEKSRHQVTPAAISSAMVSLVDGGLWFRRHFSMLVLSTLVACMRNGYANQMYFHHFDDVKRIRDLNWCKLLVDSLVETQAAWKSGSHKCFVGPAEFVAELLQERKLSKIRLGGFGCGVIELPLLNGGNVDSGGGHPQGSDVVVGGCSCQMRSREFGPQVVYLLLFHSVQFRVGYGVCA
nr:uncharacterized protein LOC109193148 isoform X2 [Ipomoea batatas]